MGQRGSRQVNAALHRYMKLERKLHTRSCAGLIAVVDITASKLRPYEGRRIKSVRATAMWTRT